MLRQIITNDWFSILFVLCLAILAIAKYTFSNRFNDFLWVIGNSKYLKIYVKEQKFIDKFDTLLFSNLIISSSIFLFICYNVFVEQVLFDIALFLQIGVGLSALILIKVLLERLIGSIFEIDEIIGFYVFQKTN